MKGLRAFRIRKRIFSRLAELCFTRLRSHRVLGEICKVSATKVPPVRLKEHILPQVALGGLPKSRSRKKSASMFSEMCSHLLLNRHSNGEDSDATKTEAKVSRQQRSVCAFNS